MSTDKPMRVLVACEFSGVVREAFRKHGHDAWSCDLIPSIDGIHGAHYICDVRTILDRDWDLMIGHPPCDRLLSSGALHWKKWQQSGEQQKAIVFFMQLALANIPRIALENPTGIMSSCWRKYDQKIQPYQFGHMEQKGVCLWLKNLPSLTPTKNVYAEMINLTKSKRERVHHESPGVVNGLTRSQRRSVFFPGIADAMAEQWGNL